MSCHKVFTNETTLEQVRRELSEIGMWEIEVNREEIQGTVGDLQVRKAIGPDGVSWHILKACFLIKTICRVVECSMSTGNFLYDWQRAIITPAYKNGNSKTPLNYRPMMLISIMCKICEKVIKKTLKRISGDKEDTDRQTTYIAALLSIIMVIIIIIIIIIIVIIIILL